MRTYRLVPALLCLLLALVSMPAVAQDLDLESLEDPADIFAWLDMPRTMDVGETARVILTVENARKSRPFKITEIDMWEEFLGGFDVVSISPNPRSQDRSFGLLNMHHRVTVPAGETWTITIEVKAKKRGVYIGDIDVYEGERWLTRKLQTRVE